MLRGTDILLSSCHCNLSADIPTRYNGSPIHHSPTDAYLINGGDLYGRLFVRDERAAFSRQRNDLTQPFR